MDIDSGGTLTKGNKEATPMSVMASRPVLRWVVPAGAIVAVLGTGILTTALRASADTRLPERSAAQLLVDLQTARLLGGGNDTQITSLIAGSHTLRVWYSGPDKARVALLAALGEQDIVHNGQDTWVWNSKDKTAVHYKGTDADKPGLTPDAAPSGLPSDLPKTP